MELQENLKSREIEMDQYETWLDNCSIHNSDYGNRRAIWDALSNNPDSVCWLRIGAGRIGVAQLIGFTTGEHLHYSVSIDRSIDIDDGDVFNRNEEEIDPTVAVDIHMSPGRGGR